MDAIGYLIGAGSMSLGVEWAGMKLTGVFETPGYSKNARTWDLNRPELAHQVLDLDPDSKLPGVYGVDMIYGNPPCGGMSTMTGSHLDSKTNLCMIQWCHMVAKNRPRTVLMENAYQVATERGAPILDQMKAILSQHGYYVWTWQFYSWQVGCPQTRRRAFLCASLDKPVNLEFVTLRDLPVDWGDMTLDPYLRDLEYVQPSPDPVLTSEGRVVTMHWWDKLGEQISDCLPQWHWIAMNKEFMTPRQAGKWMNSEVEKDREEYRYRVQNGLYWPDCPACFENMQQFRRPHRCPIQGPAHTVLSDFRLVHPTIWRLMTMRECARLTGFPDWWQFHECKAYLLAQGVPAFNSRWAADRLLKVIGLR